MKVYFEGGALSGKRDPTDIDQGSWHPRYTITLDNADVLQYTSYQLHYVLQPPGDSQMPLRGGPALFSGKSLRSDQ